MFILPFDSKEATLELAGGKGASLAQLFRIGQPVPPGFIVTTAAYREYVSANGLEQMIAAALAGLSAGDAAGLEAASAHIRTAFAIGSLPDATAGQIVGEYRRFDPASAGVAVRSSATAEDLPDLSFAGQQDTYLNVVGETQFRKALVECWSSLWTARAIGYRLRNDIPQTEAALAVIVQRMVAGDVSGVLFTANPLTGLRSEAVIDATFGLGEALVSGQVEPDHYVANPLDGALLSVTLGSKSIVTRGKAGGGVVTQPEQVSGRQTLSGEQVHQLVTAGKQIQEVYGFPQDIEWTFANGQLSILQSRPITSLFPIPKVSFDPLIIWASFGAVQGLLGPMTPLGQEAIQRVVLGVGQRLKIKLTYEAQDILTATGERIWVKVSDLIRHPLGFRIMNFSLGFIEPDLAQIIGSLAADPSLGAARGRFKFSTLIRMMRFVLPIAVRFPASFLRPESARRNFDAALEAYLHTFHIPPGKDRFERLGNVAGFMAGQGGLADALPTLVPRFIPMIGPAFACMNLIRKLLPKNLRSDPAFSSLVWDITRGLPRNVTTEMDLTLWQTATLIKQEPLSVKVFETDPAATLAARFKTGNLPAAAQSALEDFLAHYGVRGVGEIDLGQPRWREDPTPVFEALQSYLQIPPESAPDLLFEKGARVAGEAIERLSREVRSQPGGWFRERLLRAAARRVRLLMGARESPKFLAVRAMAMVRNVLLEIGEEFAASGTIARRDDLFFLHVSELEALARGEGDNWKALINGRRQVYQREARRRMVPKILVSDGRAFHEGIGAATDSGEVISGSPVSPGMVEGKVRVVLNPRQAHLLPGEIMVCPGTDPAWTPLFMAAGGLIMEVGGMMTHGSVVAREYGIPAVVGVHQATLRLKDGQRIRLDGSSGKIVIL